MPYCTWDIFSSFVILEIKIDRQTKSQKCYYYNTNKNEI